MLGLGWQWQRGRETYRAEGLAVFGSKMPEKVFIGTSCLKCLEPESFEVGWSSLWQDAPPLQPTLNSRSLLAFEILTALLERVE